MTGRDFHDSAPQTSTLVMRSNPNWPAVVFFGGLAFLHLTISGIAFFNGRWEAYLSVAFGVLFTVAAVFASRCRQEISIIPSERRIRLRHGSAKLFVQRHIHFRNVHAVRLTFLSTPDYPISRIELLCDSEDIECPPTTIPRQTALCLAMTLGVELIKVSGGEMVDEPHLSRV